MLVPAAFATLLTRLLDLFRDPAAKAEQKVQFRALLALLRDDAATLALEADERLRINGVPVEGAAYGSLVRRLALHGVRELTIPAGVPPGHMFELLKALCAEPGDVALPARLDAAGASRITVTLAAARLDVGADGIVHGGMADVPAGPPPVAPAPPEAPPPAPARDAAPVAPAISATRPSAELLADLQRDPASPQVSDILAVLGRQLEAALQANRLEQAIRIVAGAARAEGQVGDEGRRRQYAIALRRMYSKRLLEAAAQLVAAPGVRDAALQVLQRGGEAGVEVLLDLLVAAPTIEERRDVFAALSQMKEGTDQLVHMLGHRQWFVVRNVAELVGELGLEDAIPGLARQLGHEDERVRKAVALALAKIGSSAAAEPLRRALRDPSPEVRIQAALGVGGRKSTALAMPLVVAMREEANEAVQQEMMLALGRIGSPDAVQALVTIAQPGGRLFGRKPGPLRVTAVEALRLAATPAAVAALEGLAADGDKQVKAAAQHALADLKPSGG